MDTTKEQGPLFKPGDKCFHLVEILGDMFISDEYFVIEGDAVWYNYENHPNGGYWQYPIEGKANECPQGFLRKPNGQKFDEVYKQVD